MSPCPDAATLRRFESGTLPDKDADTLADHVESCSSCAQAMEQFRCENLDARVVRAAISDDATRTVDPETPGTPPSTTAGLHTSQAWGIPDYERIRVCGEGAYGTVWAVRDRVGLYRALKTIDLDRLKADNVRCRESTALEAYCRRIERHPNLIEIFHIGRQGNLLYYTMELADDDSTRKPVRKAFPKTYRPLTLRQIIDEGPIGVDTAIEVVLRLLRGLSRLHAVGLAHRDIKPANTIFVDKQPKLADIGMITANTMSPSNVGTPDYMPPDGQMDLTADTYAMGRMLYQLMVGRKHDDFPKLPQRCLNATSKWNMDKINDVLAAASAPRADDRFANADKMLDEIESCRALSYDSLLEQLAPMTEQEPEHPPSPYTPIIIAAINALPWILGAIAAIIVILKVF